MVVDNNEHIFWINKHNIYIFRYKSNLKENIHLSIEFIMYDIEFDDFYGIYKNNCDYTPKYKNKSVFYHYHC